MTSYCKPTPHSVYLFRINYDVITAHPHHTVCSRFTSTMTSSVHTHTTQCVLVSINHDVISAHPHHTVCTCFTSTKTSTVHTHITKCQATSKEYHTSTITSCFPQRISKHIGPYIGLLLKLINALCSTNHHSTPKSASKSSY